MELVHVITDLGRTLSKLVHVPMIGITLRTMRGPANAAGFGALQAFLETGYTRFKAIPDVELFLDIIDTRMVGVFEGIFGLPLAELDVASLLETVSTI